MRNRLYYLALLLLGVTLTGYSQGSKINSTVQTYPGGYYGVYGQLELGTGYIVTPRSAPASSSAYFTPGSSYTGASAASHVDGYAEKEGNTAFVFPIGNGVKLRTASISAPSSSARFQAAYWYVSPNVATLPAGAPFPTANLGSGLSAVSTKEYWDVNGALPVNLTLSWDTESDLATLTGNTLSKLVIVGYNPSTSKWENLGAAGGTTGIISTTGSITANGVTPNNYSAFTFGSSGASATPDLRPLYVMSDVGYIKPSSLTKNATLRILNVGQSGSVSSGPITVYIYPPNNQFSLALGSAPGWAMTYDAGGNYYTLTSTSVTVAYGPTNFKSVPLVITAAPATSKGKYNINFEIGEGSGGETNSLNNTVLIELTVSGL